MSGGQRRAGSQSAHPDDSIRIQACSEWRPRILSTLRVVPTWPSSPRRASSLSRPSKRYNRSSISEIPAPPSFAWPGCIERYSGILASRNETFYKYYQFSTNRMRKSSMESSYGYWQSGLHVSCHFLFKSSYFCFEQKFL